MSKIHRSKKKDFSLCKTRFHCFSIVQGVIFTAVPYAAAVHICAATKRALFAKFVFW